MDVGVRPVPLSTHRLLMRVPRKVDELRGPSNHKSYKSLIRDLISGAIRTDNSDTRYTRCCRCVCFRREDLLSLSEYIEVDMFRSKHKAHGGNSG